MSESLSTFGIKGMSPTNLRKFREFYQNYKIQQALPAELDKFPETMQNTIEYLSSRFVLGWTHYVTLMTVKNDEERKFYEIEAAKNGWGYRELERQINSALFERLVLSRDKNGVKELSTKGQIVAKPADIIKNPYILEFTGLEPQKKYTEHELETAIIDKLELFILELGKGFLFESRQKRFSFDNRHFYVDLVFYNRLLKCFVVIDLKIGDLKHQDLGQMQMYVNYFDRYVKTEEENPTVGILLCLTKSDSLVELTLPKDRNIYASNYQLYLPSKEELKKQIEEAEKEFSKNK
ncbi:MAG TPA: PDDEXK nuclease domain-containing protein [bacterium]|nr:PDDEXK nuclease domain-containing protein [bacterium]